MGIKNYDNHEELNAAFWAALTELNDGIEISNFLELDAILTKNKPQEYSKLIKDYEEQSILIDEPIISEEQENPDELIIIGYFD